MHNRGGGRRGRNRSVNVSQNVTHLHQQNTDGNGFTNRMGGLGGRHQSVNVSQNVTHSHQQIHRHGATRSYQPGNIYRTGSSGNTSGVPRHAYTADLDALNTHSRNRGEWPLADDIAAGQQSSIHMTRPHPSSLPTPADLLGLLNTLIKLHGRPLLLFFWRPRLTIHLPSQRSTWG